MPDTPALTARAPVQDDRQDPRGHAGCRAGEGGEARDDQSKTKARLAVIADTGLPTR